MGRKRRRARIKKPVKAPSDGRPVEVPDEGHEPGWRVWLAAIAVMIAIGPLCLLLLEVGLRVGHYGYPTGFFLRISGQESYETNPRYGWKFFPPAISRNPVVTTVSAEKAPDTYRIFVLGGSAAMGVPEPGFSFGRILEAILERRYPGVTFEVVNAAMTAINSHVVLPIATDCARLQPDLFIVYMGNNEVVGPYGPGTVFAANTNLSLVRAGIWLRSTRVAQLVETTAEQFRSPETSLREWRGMEMFVDNIVPADDRRMERVYQYLRENLTDICRVGQRAGADVIIATVISNLKDSPPFASVHQADLSEAEQARWQTLYDGAWELFRSGEYASAADRLTEASMLDDRYADLHFLLARCLLALNRSQEARQHFILARDLDALRFRADSRINQVIREVAAEQADTGVQLADIESDWLQNGSPGDELFYEHVHLRFSGNYLLARELLPTVEASLPDWIRRRAGGDAPVNETDAADALTYTDWDRYELRKKIFQLMEGPPFTDQMGYQERRRQRAQQLTELESKLTAPGALSRIGEEYMAAVRKEPDDLELGFRFADLLSRSGGLAEADEQWRRLIAQVPDVSMWHRARGAVLAEENQLGEALDEMRQAVQLNPHDVSAQFGLGSVLEQIGRMEEAGVAYEKVLRMDPGYADGHNRLGIVLFERGEFGEAVEHFREALRLDPGLAEARKNLDAALARSGQGR